MSQKPDDQTPMPGVFDPVAAMKPLMSNSWMGTAWLDSLADLGGEMSAFIADRIRQDVQTQHKLLHCKTIEEVQHVQAEFLQKAFDQYQAETGKLIEMTGKMAVEMQNSGTAKK